MNFQEAVRYLLSLGRELAAPTQAAAAKFNLENIRILAEHLGHPEKKYPCVHIAGTNGKGSTAAFLEAILREAGYRTGLYTSPHLERINERIRMDGEEIPDERFADVFTRIHEVIEKLLAGGTLRAHPTFFECVTAIAFVYFAEAGVDFAVLETGLGGRLDATNIVAPEVAIITHIDFDHENFLGHSLREIAGEKAGIIKADIPLVMAKQHEEAREVLLAKARELHAPVIETVNAYRIEFLKMEHSCARATVIENESGKTMQLAPPLAGLFQLKNALNAVAAAHVLKERGFRLPDGVVELGIATAVWPGRIEKVHADPDIYLDGAHNPAAARELAAFLQEHFGDRNVFMIFGALRDKAVDEIAGILFPHAREVIFTEPRTTRSISAAQLAEIAGHHAAASSVVPDAEQALETVMAKVSGNDAIFITGSLYLVGQLRGRLLKKKADAAP
ncbi:MAG TPA: folylpolyglutamate synthase/dihydrofolate synthase family protein [Candidatus Acidoferrum sp.]|nr:folylpolyglutamate synthase/dihydrofolate synthase family protein [Candidatus Acidoferrum sp.]